MDIVGPFPMATGQRKFLLVAVDYFSKWVEAEPLAKITEQMVKKFIWQNIICRFGIPRRLISNNGRQFTGKLLEDWCKSFGIEQHFTSVAYPQSNGQAEVANREILRFCGLGSTIWEVAGWMRCQASYGPSERPRRKELASRPSIWCMAAKRLFLSKLASSPLGSRIMIMTTPSGGTYSWTWSKKREPRRPSG